MLVQAKGEELSLTEVQAEINKHQRELTAMQAALPTSVSLGLAALHLVKVATPCSQLQSPPGMIPHAPSTTIH